ncbi:MAG: REP-associated tyrosine transposase [Planctomycetota bacterium]|jgi:putative transposase
MPNSGHRKTIQHKEYPGHAHELTFTCHRKLPLLKSERTRRWFIDAVKTAQEKHDFDIWALVIMPEHVHILVIPMNQLYGIGVILKSIKQSVARRAIRYLKENSPEFLRQLEITKSKGEVFYRFWKQGPGYDRNVVKVNTAWKMVDYIHRNPVRRGLVSHPLDWPWSTAGYYHKGSDCFGLEVAKPK